MIESVIVKILGDIEDLELQLKIKPILQKHLNEYIISAKSTELVVSDIIEQATMFLAIKQSRGLAEGTIKNYKYELIRFANTFNRPLNSIKNMDLILYIASFKDIKATTKCTRINILKNFFGWLHETEYIGKNPSKYLDKPKTEKRLREGLTKEELERVKQACSTDREKVIVEFLAATGCRVSEASNLKIKDIDFNKKIAIVVGKGNKQRKVHFDAKTKILLEIYINNRKRESEYAFITQIGEIKKLGTRQFERLISDIGTKCGIKLFPHRLRHTFCSHKANSGMNMGVLQGIMGHEDLATTQRYFKINDEVIESEYNRLS